MKISKLPASSPTNKQLTDPLEQAMAKDHSTAHLVSPKQLESIYGTNLNKGLLENQAVEILRENGLNIINELPKPSYLNILLQNMFNRFQCIMLICAVLSFLASQLTKNNRHDTWQYLKISGVLTAAVIGTGAYGFFKEVRRITRTNFRSALPKYSTVVRDGQKRTVPNCKVVTGDIVEMEKGEIVPADVRIIECEFFKTNNASFTEILHDVCHQTEGTHKVPLLSKNMAFFCNPVTEGWAKGVVVATGKDTEIGKIIELVTKIEKPDTPLSKHLAHFDKVICITSLFLGALFYTYVLIFEGGTVRAMTLMLSVLLATVPEGLGVILHTYMSISFKQLRRNNCLAKSKQAIQTLGFTSVICTGKSFLTENRMTIAHLICDFKIYDKKYTHLLNPFYDELCLTACLNIGASFSENDVDESMKSRKVSGDINEAAILRYMEFYKGATEVKARNPIVAELPFNSENRYAVTIHQLESGQYFLVMKGAPEVILEFCSTVLSSNPDTKMMTHNVKQELLNIFTKLSNMGEHVIAYCDLRLSSRHFPKGFMFTAKEIHSLIYLKKLQFVGGITIKDQVRPGVKSVISKFKNAGIKVVLMTSGDSGPAALALARQVGIVTNPTAYDSAIEKEIDVTQMSDSKGDTFEAAVLTGEDLRKMSADELQEALKKHSEIIFSETSPEQKAFIVKKYQEMEEVVTVMGNGMNISLALKQAHMGITMTDSLDISKYFADMTLANENLGFIAKGIEDSRRLFNNLKKSIAFMYTSTTPEIIALVVHSIIGLPVPITPSLILAINLGINLWPAMSLALESSDEDLMKKPPTKLKDKLVSRNLLYMAFFQIGLIEFIAAMVLYYTIYAEDGFFFKTLFNVRKKWESGEERVVDSYGRFWWYEDRKSLEKKAQTGYFMSVSLMQVANLVICKVNRESLFRKGMKNCALNVAILVVYLITVSAVYLPPWQEFLRVRPVEWRLIFSSIPFYLLMILSDEYRRYIIRNRYSTFVEKNLCY